MNNRIPILPAGRQLVRPAALCLWAGLLLAGGGCSTSGVDVSLDTWQKGLESYVNDVGRGDPAVLREVEVRGRPGFAQVGHPVAAEGTDAVGLLLGSRPVGGKPALVYLVGLVEAQKLEDVRLAAVQVTASPGGPAQFHWLMSPENDAARDQYLAYRRRQFESRFPGRSDIPPAYTSFPAEDDRFTLIDDPAGLTARHDGSGATWVLPVK